VLIAEDHAGFREALSLVVERAEGLELVGVAVDALEAIALAAREQPDVALIDLRMPAGGGVAAARGIAARSARTRMIVLSAYVMQLEEPSVVGQIRKGAPAGEIVDAVRRAARDSSEVGDARS
jgi:DNA-binding NarL/FixJ family response regulator